jgi:putative peptidoglycan lipid II flippase
VIFGYGAARVNVPDFALALALFAPGLVLFTTHYLVLRGFYALERTRTVFWVQCVIAVTNIGLAIAVTHQVGPAGTAPGLVLAYAGSYLVGAVASYSLLRHVLGGLQTPVLVRFLVRLLLAAGIATGIAWAVRHGITLVWDPAGGTGREPGATSGSAKAQAVTLLAVTGLVDVVVFLLLARAMRIREVTSVIAALTGRLRR